MTILRTAQAYKSIQSLCVGYEANLGGGTNCKLEQKQEVKSQR